jgi:nucleoside-diphosphate-sugar epimerase
MTRDTFGGNNRLKILLTGAFGNVGKSTLEKLLEKNYQVRCFDLATRKNKREARKYRQKVELFWGDLRNPMEVYEAVKGMDIIIHLGAVIPPLANNKPELSEGVNVGGTLNIVTAIKRQKNKPKLIYSSSVAIYGDVRDLGFEHEISTGDSFNPSPHDHYARQKIKCERIIRKANIPFVILRFAAIPPIDLKTDPLMFDVPLDTPIEFCHTEDTGRAVANAVESKEALGKTLHIGGGKDCRLPYSEYVGQLLEVMGIGMLPKEAFGSEPFHCGYMDTKLSQELLQYQKKTMENLVTEIAERYKFIRFFVRLLRPIIRYFLLKKSSHYQQHLKAVKAYLGFQKQTRKNKKKKKSHTLAQKQMKKFSETKKTKN